MTRSINERAGRASIYPVAHRGYVIQAGQIVLHDTAGKLLGSDLVRKSYLGEK